MSRVLLRKFNHVVVGLTHDWFGRQDWVSLLFENEVNSFFVSLLALRVVFSLSLGRAPKRQNIAKSLSVEYLPSAMEDSYTEAFRRKPL